ncbi:MAG: two-component system CheB/CheR fusion protein, partial [Saprospiraceae bacterium]
MKNKIDKTLSKQEQTNINDELTIVGVGSSAGGLEALQDFFDNMAPQANMAYVCIQHLSPDYKSLMVELLSKRSDMHFVEAENDLP